MNDHDRDMRDAARDAEQDAWDDRPTLAECEADRADERHEHRKAAAMSQPGDFDYLYFHPEAEDDPF